MLKHIVLLKFKSGVTDREISDLEKAMGSLPGVVPEIIGFQFGRDPRSEKVFDFALVSDFADFEALGRYRVHPEHVKVLQKVKALSESFQAVDFLY